MPLDFIIRFRCDNVGCGEENTMIHIVEPKQMPVLVEHFGIKDAPPGWSINEGKTYCAEHGTRLVKPSALSLSAIAGGRRN
jgi:hypothetical protein